MSLISSPMQRISFSTTLSMRSVSRISKASWLWRGTRINNRQSADPLGGWRLPFTVLNPRSNRFAIFHCNLGIFQDPFDGFVCSSNYVFEPWVSTVYVLLELRRKNIPRCSNKLILSRICSCLSARSFIVPCIFEIVEHSCRNAFDSEYRSGLGGVCVWLPWIVGLGGRCACVTIGLGGGCPRCAKAIFVAKCGCGE